MNNTLLIIQTLLVKSKKRLNALIIFFATLLIFFSCGTPPAPNKTPFSTLTSEERQWMEKLFVDLLLDESGIYTLYGTKPMTRISVCYYTAEEIRDYFKNHPEEQRGEPIYGVGKYDLPENWGKWEKIQSVFPMYKFLLFKKPLADDPKLAEIYFINILESALLIEKQYALFKKKLGHDFDALEVVFEAEDDNSEFWKTVNNDAVLFGLLCGFGEKNSLCFDWKHTERSDRINDFTQTLKFHFSATADCSIRDLTNLPIPTFASFSERGRDPIVSKYEKEREKIKKIYRGKNFLDVTLQQLTSK